MITRNYKSLRRHALTLSALVLAPSIGALAQEPTSPPPDPASVQDNQPTDPATALSEVGSEDATPMMRGPLHEAFAEQFSTDAEPSVVIAKQPPEAINEQPPEYQPEGENIQWIAGYWGWDVEADDFIWVTGIWRQVPPDQQWIPGYWAEVDGGWQWVSGFWNTIENSEIAYLPTPPASVDNGPSEPAPGENYFWIPGSWQYQQTEYVWQAGYWAPAHDNWVWVADRYVWTPSGYIYRPGYWDYDVIDRGTIFCPVVFRPGYQQVYRPTYTVELGPSWFANLFVVPGFHHYSYGNYYGYQGRYDIVPWVTYYQTSQRYDPLYSYYAYQGRNANWIRQLSRLERQFASANPTPNRTTVAAYLSNQGAINANTPGLRVSTLQALANRENTNFNSPFSFKSLDARMAKELDRVTNPARQFATQRAQLERANNDIDRRRTARIDSSIEANAGVTAQSLKRLKLQSNKAAAGLVTATGITVQNESREPDAADNLNPRNRDRNRGDANDLGDAAERSRDVNRNRDRRDRNPLAGDDPNRDGLNNELDNPRANRNRNPNLGSETNRDPNMRDGNSNPDRNKPNAPPDLGTDANDPDVPGKQRTPIDGNSQPNKRVPGGAGSELDRALPERDRGSDIDRALPQTNRGNSLDKALPEIGKGADANRDLLDGDRPPRTDRTIPERKQGERGPGADVRRNLPGAPAGGANTNPPGKNRGVADRDLPSLGNTERPPRSSAPGAGSGTDSASPGATRGNNDRDRSPSARGSGRPNPLDQIQRDLDNKPLGGDEMKQLQDRMRGQRGNSGAGGSGGIQFRPGMPSNPQRNDPRLSGAPNIPGLGGGGAKPSNNAPQGNKGGGGSSEKSKGGNDKK